MTNLIRFDALEEELKQIEHLLKYEEFYQLFLVYETELARIT